MGPLNERLLYYGVIVGALPGSTVIVEIVVYCLELAHYSVR